MEKLNKVKKFVKSHIQQTIVISVCTLAIGILIVILCIGSCGRDENGVVTTEKSAQEKTTTDKIITDITTTEKETTKETDEATTEENTQENSDEETTRQEETTDNIEVIQKVTTSGQNATTQPITTTKQQSVTKRQQQTTTRQQPTTTKQQPTTTKPQPTTTAPVRGRNGVILEELYINRKSGEVTPVPKTKYELSGGNPNHLGLLYLYDDKIKALFNNEVKLYDETTKTGSTEADIKALYGEPMNRYVYSDVGETLLIYQYLDIKRDSNEVIYIRFSFWKVEADLKDNVLGGVGIGNKDDVDLEGKNVY